MRREEFVSEESFVIHDEEFGSVEVHTDQVTFGADAGGWHWRGTGQDREKALRRLEDRVRSRNPFDGMDTDWGDPGYRLPGPLSPATPPHIAQRMEEYVHGGQ